MSAREKISPNFFLDEFDCKCGCGWGDISEDLVRRLQEVRDSLGLAMKVTSGIRCKKHNGNIGGSGTSAHVPDDSGVGYAVDIACNDSVYREKLLKEAFKVFDRIGVAKTFIHLDIHTGKTAGVCWLY